MPSDRTMSTPNVGVGWQVLCIDAPIKLQEVWVSELVSSFSIEVSVHGPRG